MQHETVEQKNSAKSHSGTEENSGRVAQWNKVKQWQSGTWHSATVAQRHIVAQWNRMEQWHSVLKSVRILFVSYKSVTAMMFISLETVIEQCHCSILFHCALSGGYFRITFRVCHHRVCKLSMQLANGIINTRIGHCSNCLAYHVIPHGPCKANGF